MVDKFNVKKISIWFLFVLILSGFLNAENETVGGPEGQPYTIGLTQTVANMTATLKVIAPHLSIGLIILGGIVYGLAQTQLAEVRGKWQTTAIGLVVGGIIIGALTAAAGPIQAGAGTLLTS